MKNERSLEIGTGLFVLLGFAALAFLTTQLPGSKLGVVTQGCRLSRSARGSTMWATCRPVRR